LSENEKLKTLQVYNEHFEKVKQQRDLYKKSALAAKAVLQSTLAVEGVCTAKSHVYRHSSRNVCKQ